MPKPNSNTRRLFTDVAAVVATFRHFEAELKKQILGFNIEDAVNRAHKRVARFYGGSHTPHQGNREKLRRRAGGFARLHNHSREPYNGGFLLRNCPICDQHLTHEQVAKTKEAI